MEFLKCQKGTPQSSYTVTDLEKDQTSDQNFCYGYQIDKMEKPAGPFFITIRACCWVDFKNDLDIVIGNRGPGKEKNTMQLKEQLAS